MTSYGMAYDFPVRLSMTVSDSVFALGFAGWPMVSESLAFVDVKVKREVEVGIPCASPIPPRNKSPVLWGAAIGGNPGRRSRTQSRETWSGFRNDHHSRRDLGIGSMTRFTRTLIIVSG